MKTALHTSPFALLRATIRDDRARIVQLADDMALELDETLCQSARSDLTNPRTRLAAEIAWLPGVSPRRAVQLVEVLDTDPMALRGLTGLPVLARMNLLSAAFQTVTDQNDPDDIVDFIQECADRVDELDPSDVLRDLNEDRGISGFPEIRALDQIEAELTERRRHLRSVIKSALDQFPAAVLVQIVTDAVEMTTIGGQEQAPALIDELVDTYESETSAVLAREADNVVTLIATVRRQAADGAEAIAAPLKRLETVARNWDRIAQPIQLSAKARGMVHDASRDLAHQIRSLSIDLFNEHNMQTQTKALADLLSELFAEVPDVIDQIEEDAEALSSILHDRTMAKEEWAREISFTANIGLIFRELLSISPHGVSWQGKAIPLEAITRVRWGGVNRSINGIQTGTNFFVAFGDDQKEIAVNLKNAKVYGAFIEKLWRAVGVRLLTEIVAKLRAGDEIPFGGCIIKDTGVTLKKPRMFMTAQAVHLPWSAIDIINLDGNFCLMAKSDRKFATRLSYRNEANTHVLSGLMMMAFKKPGMRRLSDILG